MAARLRRELRTDVQMVRGHYGEFQVLVDGAVVVDGGTLAFLGVLPTGRTVVDVVRERLGVASPPPISTDLHQPP